MAANGVNVSKNYITRVPSRFQRVKVLAKAPITEKSFGKRDLVYLRIGEREKIEN